MDNPYAKWGEEKGTDFYPVLNRILKQPENNPPGKEGKKVPMEKEKLPQGGGEKKKESHKRAG
jgi:hypothetical protein